MNNDLALDSSLAHLHAQRPFHHREQLVLVVVVMPNKLAVQLHQLYVGVVYLAHDLWAVVISEQRQLLREIDLVHSNPIQTKGTLIADALWSIGRYLLQQQSALAIAILSHLFRRNDRRGGHTIAFLQMQQVRSEEHTSELQSPCNLVCRL